MVNEVNEGIVDIVVDREQLKCGYADAASGGVLQGLFVIVCAWDEFSHVHQSAPKSTSMHK